MQVAEQQGRYLAEVLNRDARHLDHPGTGSGGQKLAEFRYQHFGSMATVGAASAIMEVDGAKNQRFSLTGFGSWVAWRSAYLTRLGSWRNRFVVAGNWFMTFVFGRDMSRW